MNNLTKYLLNLMKKVQFFSKFSARFARLRCFLLFSSPLHSLGILETLFIFISINCLTKPTYINAFLPCF